MVREEEQTASLGKKGGARSGYSGVGLDRPVGKTTPGHVHALEHFTPHLFALSLALEATPHIPLRPAAAWPFQFPREQLLLVLVLTRNAALWVATGVYLSPTG